MQIVGSPMLYYHAFYLHRVIHPRNVYKQTLYEGANPNIFYEKVINKQVKKIKDEIDYSCKASSMQLFLSLSLGGKPSLTK